MKILHIIVGLGVGGAEMMLKRLIESHLAKPDYRHSVISLTNIGSIGQQLQAQGIDITELGMRSPLDVFTGLVRLRKLIRESSPDIVQSWMYHADLLGGIAARLAGNRNIIWGIHSTDVRAGGSRATTWVMHACAKLSHWVPDTIMCVAEVSRRVHVKAGYDESRMVVVPNGLDLENLVATQQQRAALRQAYGFTDGELVIGTVGRFNPAKDYETFVRAAGILAQGHPNVRFVMIGSKLDASNEILVSWISQTGHSDRFLLLGERHDVAAHLSAIDIFCLSSRSEALPTVVAEAMAMGVPCVATDVGDTAMLIADSGVVVPKEQPGLLAQGLAQISNMSREERILMGARGKKRIHAEFTIECARSRFESIYHGIIKKKKG